MSEAAEFAVGPGPDAKAILPGSASEASAWGGEGWDGPTYYHRPQLKAAPFENSVVGGYIFVGGLSGATMLISAIADRARGKEAAGLVRRGRYLALLGPTLGSVLLIYDLHTPQRFYNMMRVAKRTSPMSIGTWILLSFSAAAGATAAAQMACDLSPRQKWARTLAGFAQIPAAVAGAGMMTYTAALLSATSTPLWAAAPRALAVRFASSSLAAGAAALSIGEKSWPISKALSGLAAAALLVELGAAKVSRRAYRDKGVAAALETPAGKVELVGATGLGVALPLGLLAASCLLRRKPTPAVKGLAALAVIAGSAALRVSIMGAGDHSANRPDISFRFAQPENLPDVT